MATKALAKAPAKVVAKVVKSALDLKTFISSISKVGDRQEDVRKILGISSARAEELKDWVGCEGTSAEAVKNVIDSLTSVNEVAYTFYWLGNLHGLDDNAPDTADN